MPVNAGKRFGIAFWVTAALLGTVVLIASTIAFHELRKKYWDTRVEELCAIDGGIRVFETVKLSPAEFAHLKDKFDRSNIPADHLAAKDVPIVRTSRQEFIRDTNPQVWRYEERAIRRSDNKILAQRITYARVGGDLIGFHASSFGCPKSEQSLFNAIVEGSKGPK